jgi:ABC-2 type transport system permease protein
MTPRKLLFSWINECLWSLILKEFRQILRNRQLIALLIFPATLQLLIFGFALNPDVSQLKISILDASKTQLSRSLISTLLESKIFSVPIYAESARTVTQNLESGSVDVGIIIPPNFAKRIRQENEAHIQVLINGIDANTAGISKGYISQIIEEYNHHLKTDTFHELIRPEIRFLYNPGLVSSWFIVPGVLGLVLTLVSSLVSLNSVMRERDTGTVEQILMTPSTSLDIILSKIIPLFILMNGEVILALTIVRLVFKVPLKGDLFSFLFLSDVYVLVGIGIGTLLGTIAKSIQQAQLITLFINPPLFQLSGAIIPIDGMPDILRFLSLFNPLRYYVNATRNILLKGAGYNIILPDIFILIIIAIVLIALSVKRFRFNLA